MNIIETEIEGLLIIEPDVFKDSRGYFLETYTSTKYNLPNVAAFVQDNEAQSDLGVLRGLHFQNGDAAQGKLVRVVKGAVYDVAVDIRPGSETFGVPFGIMLTGENKKQLWVPRGFAHGYLVLEDETIFSYKCDNFYNKSAEGGIHYDDPDLAIPWPTLKKPYLVSEKDQVLGSLHALLK